MTIPTQTTTPDPPALLTASVSEAVRTRIDPTDEGPVTPHTRFLVLQAIEGLDPVPVGDATPDVLEAATTLLQVIADDLKEAKANEAMPDWGETYLSKHAEYHLRPTMEQAQALYHLASNGTRDDSYTECFDTALIVTRFEVKGTLP